MLAPMEKRAGYINGTVVKCIRPTPGLRLNEHYAVVEVVRDIIMGPLFMVRPERAFDVLPDAYYPWRFEIVN